MSAGRIALRIAFSGTTRHVSRCLSSSLTRAPLVTAQVASPFSAPFQTRGVKTLNFGGTTEDVVERADYPKSKLQDMFKNDTFAVLGYGPQGMAQALNLRDNGMRVIVGLRPDGESWKQAIADGFKPGESLFDITQAAEKGTVVMYLLSDAAQKECWESIKPFLTPGKTLYFSHGFSIVYHDLTGVVPPDGIDIILVAPKGSGTTVRRLFLQGRGINSSVAVHTDVSGKARDRAFGIGIGVGSGYCYETTFKKEVFSDLTGERGVLMGAIQGLFRAQYDTLRAAGHSPSEAFNETVEEATQSLYPLIGEKGMDWMYANCSATAQRGALDWAPRFYEATRPVFEDLYKSVADGSETQRTLDVNSQPDFKKKLNAELEAIANHEMWRAGVTVRSLRPENTPKKV